LDTKSENTDGEEGDGHSAEAAQSDPEYEPDDQEDDEDSSGDDGNDYQDLESLNYTAITDRKSIPSEPKNDATTDLKKTSITRSDNTKDLSARLVSCPICHKQFKGRWAKKTLKIHLDLHAPEPKYPCPHCHAKFKQDTARRSHIKEVHLKVKKLACAFCAKQFAYPFKKKLHEMVRNYRFSKLYNHHITQSIIQG
jgi:hypothetical protein